MHVHESESAQPIPLPRDFACDVREKVFSKKYTFVVVFGSVWGSVHLPCHGDVSQDDLWWMLKEMEDVVINLRRRHRTSRIVIGSDLNVSLAPSLEGLTGSRIHSNANGASSRWPDEQAETGFLDGASLAHRLSDNECGLGELDSPEIRRSMVDRSVGVQCETVELKTVG